MYDYVFEYLETTAVVYQVLRLYMVGGSVRADLQDFKKIHIFESSNLGSC